MVLNTVSASVVGLPVAPTNGAISASTSVPIVSRPLPPSTVKRDRRALDRDDLADEAGEIRDGATELPGEQLEQRALLLGGRALVDEDDRLPGLRDQDVLRDVGGDRHRQPADVDALDRALLDAPGDHRVAGLVVRVLADPARAQDVAGADLQQPAFDLVRHDRRSSACLGRSI